MHTNRPRTTVAILAFALIAALMAFTPRQATAQGHFSDTAGHFAHGAINHLMDRGGILGDPWSTWCGPSHFCPDRPTPRWIAATWLVRAILQGQEPPAVTQTRFSDIPATAYWAPYVEFIGQLGLSFGYPDGTYRPHEPVTRRQMNKFFQRGLNTGLVAGDPAPLRNGALLVKHTCRSGDIDCLNETVSRGESAALLASGLQGMLDSDRTAVNPPTGGGFRELSAGSFHACAIRDDERLLCWGDNTFGQTLVPSEHRYRRVDAGATHTCAVRLDFQVECWGRNDHGQADQPQGQFYDVASGSTATCGIVRIPASFDPRERTIRCWGSDEHGIIREAVAMQDAGKNGYVTISMSLRHACAARWITVGGDGGGFGTSLDIVADCWGDDADGATAIPTGPDGQAPSSVVSANAGWRRSCLTSRIDSDSDDLTDWRHDCWGRDEHGVTSPPKGSYAGIALGWNHACGVLTAPYGTVRCWGLNDAGQAEPPTDTSYHELAAGGFFTCGIAIGDRTIDCWGHDLDQKQAQEQDEDAEQEEPALSDIVGEIPSDGAPSDDQIEDQLEELPGLQEVGPEDPADPEEPAEDPEDPADPEEPAEDPEDPADPEEPAEEPEDPADPEEPAEDPEDPADPEDPGDEEAPADEEEPGNGNDNDGLGGDPNEQGPQ